jgi:hypothetical protein
MARLEDLHIGTRLTGLAAAGTATVESVQWIGEQALKVIFRDGDGHARPRSQIAGILKEISDGLPGCEYVRMTRNVRLGNS